MYLPNAVVYLKSSAMQDAAHYSVVRWAGLSSTSFVRFFGAGGHCSAIGPLGGGVSLPDAPLVRPYWLLMLGSGLYPGLLAGPSPPLSPPLLLLSSSLQPPGGGDDSCEAFDAGFRILKAISTLFHSIRASRVMPMVLAPSSMGMSISSL